MAQVKNTFAQPALDGDNTLDLTGTWKIGGTTVTSSAAELNIVDGVTATASEINAACDISVQTETLAAAGAVSVVRRITNLALVGAGAVTLAAPDASMVGHVKIITMTVDNGDVTLALTNIIGQSAGTTATFDAVGDTLVLVGGVSKWIVVGEGAITLA